MAVGTPVDRGRAGWAVSTGTCTTASFTPSANSRLFACASNYANTTPPTGGTVTDSLGSSWTKIGSDLTYDPGSNRRTTAVLYYLDVGASPSARTVTFAGAGNEGVLSVIEVSGTGGTTFNVQDAGNTAGDPSITKSPTPSTGSAVFAWDFPQGGNGQTPPSGYTELFDADASGGGSRFIEFCYDLTSPGTTLTWASGNINAHAVAIEVFEATSDQTVTGALYTDSDTFFGATVSATYTVTGALYSDADTFFGATLSLTYAISGALYVDSDSFFAAQIDQFLFGNLYTDADTFPTGTISATYDVSGALFTDGDNFFAATLTPVILGALYSDADTFFGATASLTYGVTGSLFSDADTFYGAVVTSGLVVSGALYADADTFFGATIGLSYTLSANRYNDPDTFYDATVSGGTVITPTGDGCALLRRRYRR